MKRSKQIKRQAKHLLRLCHVNGTVDENRAREIVRHILGSKRRGHLALATEFERLMKLEQAQHTAKVESAAPLPLDVKTVVTSNLLRLYGPDLTTIFIETPSLIGGIRIKVGSDVYDGSVRARLAALDRAF